MDLGECSRMHEIALRADYELAARDKDYFYDVDVSYQQSFLFCIT